MTRNAVINLQAKLASFEDQWAPKVIAEMNDYQFKLVKLQGDFVWHNHDKTDETFIVLKGKMTMSARSWSLSPVASSILVDLAERRRQRTPSGYSGLQQVGDDYSCI